MEERERSPSTLSAKSRAIVDRWIGRASCPARGRVFVPTSSCVCFIIGLSRDHAATRCIVGIVALNGALMSWVTFIWALVLGACVTMALPHLFVGVKRRAWENLLFTVAAFGRGGHRLRRTEASCIRGRPRKLAAALQWMHVPVLFSSWELSGSSEPISGRAGRWLGISAVGVALGSLGHQFCFSAELEFPRDHRLCGTSIFSARRWRCRKG